MSNASHKTTKTLTTRELNARVLRIGKMCNRPVSQTELEVIFAWIDAVLFDYFLVQAALAGKIRVHLPAEEVTSVEQFVEAMKVSAASHPKPRFN